jgi:hypothetical protein
MIDLYIHMIADLPVTTPGSTGGFDGLTTSISVGCNSRWLVVWNTWIMFNGDLIGILMVT